MKKNLTKKTLAFSTKSTSLRKIPSWNRAGSLNRLEKKTQRFSLNKAKSDRTLVASSLYSPGRIHADNDDHSDQDMESSQSMSKTYSDASMGTVSSWGCISAPWEKEFAPQQNVVWQSNVQPTRPSSLLKSPQTEITISCAIPKRRSIL